MVINGESLLGFAGSADALSKPDVLIPQQLRAARALVDWSREDLARHSGVPEITTRQFELGRSDPRQTTVHKWRRALERAGVVFLEPDEGMGPGVRLLRNPTD